MRALLERAGRGDPQALGEVYDRFVERIYSYIYHRVGQAELAEDLTGQVFIRMLEAIRSGQGWRTSFSGWLYRIAHNLVIDFYRRRSRASFVDIDEAPPISSTEEEPARKVQATLDREDLRAALTQLTEEQAQVITLRFLEDLSIAEVATIMGKNEGAIKALQYRAILALRRIMQP
ncbi:MAG: sigma-70 family RNA polymerase sigma factor [Anaerolineae bacterium]